MLLKKLRMKMFPFFNNLYYNPCNQGDSRSPLNEPISGLTAGTLKQAKLMNGLADHMEQL